LAERLIYETICPMYRVEQTDEFEEWLTDLRDRKAAARVTLTVNKVKRGLIADWKSVGDDVMEVRLTYGPGYRLYFTFKGKKLVLLLCGGDKSTQRKDIKLAKELKEEYCG
jgi:putative addiction module killer protein